VCVIGWLGKSDLLPEDFRHECGTKYQILLGICLFGSGLTSIVLMVLLCMNAFLTDSSVRSPQDRIISCFSPIFLLALLCASLHFLIEVEIFLSVNLEI
jgi:hypothetical protein